MNPFLSRLRLGRPRRGWRCTGMQTLRRKWGSMWRLRGWMEGATWAKCLSYHIQIQLSASARRGLAGK